MARKQCEDITQKGARCTKRQGALYDGNKLMDRCRRCNREMALCAVHYFVDDCNHDSRPDLNLSVATIIAEREPPQRCKWTTKGGWMHCPEHGKYLLKCIR